jgi:Uma2 family endonuclease
MPSGIKAELIGGVVYMPSPVKRVHCTQTSLLVIWVGLYMEATPGVEVMDNGTTVLADDSEPQPDVALRVIHGGQTHENANGYVAGCPEMVCEVANSSVSYDMHAKRFDYERYGAQEYVVAILRDPRVAWFARNGDHLVEVPPDADGIYRSRAYPGLWLDPSALMAGDLRKLLEVLRRGIATPEHAAFAAALTPSPGAASGG